jgi:Mn2+/Fe2+ NRAMP family transporter
VSWDKVGWAIIWPPLSIRADYLMAIVAVFGTTTSPYLFFWQAGQEVEETKEDPDARPLVRAPRQAEGEFNRIRIDTYIGMGISNFVACASSSPPRRR